MTDATTSDGDSLTDSAVAAFETIKALDTNTFVHEWVVPYGMKLLLAITIFVVGRWLAKFVSTMLGKIVLRTSKDEMLQSFVHSLAYFFFLLIVIIASLSQLGVNTSSLVALIGAAGLAIGLALQNSLQNFAAGVMILVFEPFKKGHYIEAADVSGTVENMGILMLELRTPDNKTILVPNGQVMSKSITNYSMNATRRVDFIFDIAYDSDIEQAKNLVQQCMAAEPRILKNPEPLIGVGSLGASSVQLYVRPWVATSDYWSVHYGLTESVKHAFDEAGIEIPYNKLDINLTHAPGASE